MTINSQFLHKLLDNALNPDRSVLLTCLACGYYRQMTQMARGSITQMSINGTCPDLNTSLN